MRLHLWFSALLAVLVWAGGAGWATAAELTVTVSILPQKAIVEAIGGEDVQVQVLVQPGASPATYEPSPRQMAKLQRSSLYFAIGVPFEKAWLPRLRQGHPGLEVVHLEDEVVRRSMAREVGGKGHDHGSGMPDPHIWLSPPLVRTFSARIAEHLAEALPSQAAQIRSRYLRFASSVAALDAELASKLAPLAANHPHFLVFHPSWGYFAKAYGLVQTPVQLEGKQPSPRALQDLVRLAEELDLQTVFVQPQFSRKTAQVVAEQIGGQVVELDPLAADWAANLRRVAKVMLRELS